MNNSNDKNHSSKFAVLVVVALKKKRNKRTKTTSKANTQPSSELTSAPKSPGGRTSSAFYKRRTRTSTIFV